MSFKDFKCKFIETLIQVGMISLITFIFYTVLLAVYLDQVQEIQKVLIQKSFDKL